MVSVGPTKLPYKCGLSQAGGKAEGRWLRVLGSTSLATGIMSLIDLFRFKRRWYSAKKEDLRCGEPSRQKAAGFPSLADGKRLFSGSRQGADGVMEVPELFLRLCMMLNVSRGTNLQNLIFDILKK